MELWIDKYSKKGGQDYSKADFIALKKELARIQEEHFNISQSCQLFGLNRLSFYKQTQRNISPAERRRKELSIEITTIYGAPKIHHQLNHKGIKDGLKLVQKLMNELGIKSIVNKKFKPAQSKSDRVSRENLVTFEPKTTNQVWSTDITYIHTQTQGWVYLSTIMDRYSKKIIAWEISGRMTTYFVTKTLEKAVQSRGTRD